MCFTTIIKKKIVGIRTSSHPVKIMFNVNLYHPLLQPGCTRTVVHLLLEIDVFSWNRDSSSFIKKTFNADSGCDEISLWQGYNNCPSYKLRGVIVFSSLIIKSLAYFKSWSEKAEKQRVQEGFCFLWIIILQWREATWRGMKLGEILRNIN